MVNNNVRVPTAKIMDVQAAVRWRNEVKDAVVFTNGVFDIIHTGHVQLLHNARAQGTALIVGINSDASVKRLKGPTRPVCSTMERAIVVAALESVDAVVVFEEDTPYELVREIQPDVIVKGGDYTPETVVGADVVRARGGRVVIVPTVQGFSTTNIIGRMRG